MKLILNGQRRELDAPCTVAELLARFELGEERVAVERNGRIVPREAFAEERIEDGDVIEIVRFVGGG
ncbi:MAG: sulfur carrier protein ThiS [Alicyclobacillus sp.]|nr:sulfur carrier protein ThiS [Alicyclobacillus sp.]